MPLTCYRLRGLVVFRLAFFLCLTSSLVVHAQDSFATDTSNSLSGFSSPKSFGPYSGEKRQDRVPAMQKEFTDASGFNWAQFLKGVAETGARFSAPRLLIGNGQSQMGGGTLFHAGSLGSGTFGDSFNLSSRGVNFSTRSSGLDLHLSVDSMFRNGFSQTSSGSSFASQGLNGSAEGGPGGLGSLGGHDAQKGSGAKISLQLKF